MVAEYQGMETYIAKLEGEWVWRVEGREELADYGKAEGGTAGGMWGDWGRRGGRGLRHTLRVL
jgi:hypothetical protein